MENNKIVRTLNIFGEFSVYLFILTLFLNRGLNFKVGYVLQGLFVLKLILDRNNIKIKGKEIYKIFGVILIVGIVINLFVSQKDGWSVFFNQNITFIFGMAFLSFIDNKKKLNKSLFLILLGCTLAAFSEILNTNLVDYSAARIRPLIMMGAVFSTILFFEKLKDWVTKRKIDSYILLMIPLLASTIGIMYSDSRMGFLVYIICVGLYGLYNLTLFKLSIKTWVTLITLTSALLGGVFFIMPKKFETRIKTSFQTKNNFSNEARLVMWKGGVYAFMAKPLTGVGSSRVDTQPYNMKSATEYSEKYNNKSMKEIFVNQKQFSEHHSIYINFLSQNGLILTLLYLYLFFIQIPKRFLLNRKNFIAISSYFTILSFLIYGVTWSVWTLYSVVQILFQIFLAIFILQTEDRKDENE